MNKKGHFAGNSRLTTRSIPHRIMGGPVRTAGNRGRSRLLALVLAHAAIILLAASTCAWAALPEIRSGECVSGTISTASPMLAYTFYGQAGQGIVLVATVTSGTLDPELFLDAPDGTREKSVWAVTQTRIDNHILAQTGWYTVTVEDYGGSNTGSFKLCLVTVPGTTSKGVIESGQCIAGSISQSLESFTFHGNTGDAVVLVATTISGTLDPEIFLYAPDGTRQKTVWAVTQARIDEQELTQTGLHTVVVEDYGGNNTGSFKLCLVKIPGATSKGIIASGQCIAGSISQSLESFTFYGGEGNSVTLTATTTAETLDPQIFLYAPDGTREASVWAVTQAKIDNHQLAQTGSYTVVVEDYGGSNIGAFTLCLTQTPNPSVQANFEADTTSGIAPLKVCFTDLSAGSVTSWSWDFGDQGTSTAQNPCHTYTADGTFDVSLTVNGASASDTELKQDYITVALGPVVSITAMDSIVSEASATDRAVFKTCRSGSTASALMVDLEVSGTALNGVDYEKTKGGPLAQSITIPVGRACIQTAIEAVDDKIAEGDETVVLKLLQNAAYRISPKKKETILTIKDNDAKSVIYVGHNPGNMVSVIDLSTNDVSATIPLDGPPGRMALNRLRGALYALHDKFLSVIRTATGEVRSKVTFLYTPVDVALNPKETRAYIVCNDSGYVYGMNTLTLAVAKDFSLGLAGHSVAVSPTGNALIVSHPDSDCLSVVDTARHTIKRVNVGSYPRHLVASPDGTRVYVANFYSSDVSIVDISDLALPKLLGNVAVGSYPAFVAQNRLGSRIYVGNQGSQNISVLQPTAGGAKLVATIDPLGNGPSGLGLNVTGTILYTALHGSASVSVFDISKNGVVDFIPVSSNPFALVIGP